jgi:hypothetical protein
MQLGGLKPITAQDWQMPAPRKLGATAPEPSDPNVAQLKQIKWLMVALLLIILIKK